MPAPASGLSRLTIRTPRRSLDLAVPHQVPLAELLPEVLRRAGEAGNALALAPVAADPARQALDGYPAAAYAGGWMLRRGDGSSLRGDLALAHQGVHDGDVLYLVPSHLSWPEPECDDMIEEVALVAGTRGRAWDVTATRLFSLAAAALVLLTGLGTLLTIGPYHTLSAPAAAVVTVILLGAGALLSRATGDGLAGAVAAGSALPYAAAFGLLFATADGAGPLWRADAVLVGAASLLFSSLVGALAVGHGLRVFAAGVTLGLVGLLGAGLAIAVPAPHAAAILVPVALLGVGLAPSLALRLSRLPLPVVSASPQALAAQTRPSRAEVLAAVTRGHELLVGSVTGVCLAALVCVAVLASAGEAATALLAGLAATALVFRSRQFPAVAARLPFLASGLLGLALTSARVAAGTGPAVRLLTFVLAFGAVVALLAVAASARRGADGRSPYLGRVGDILDVLALVALVPVACAVLGLFGWVRGLSG